ncbi:hypothetical protein J6590_050084 [Homalodisca vitripennis]|nr:hypothetical protein J6590_050084 [Homalodisca vitripennis]
MGIYRPPQTNLDDLTDVISTELDKLINLNNPIVIMGDINVDNLTNNKEKQILAEALEGCNLRRLELPPTRVTHHISTSIDFICTNLNEDHIAYNITTTGLSDYTAQVCSITAEVQNTTFNVTKRRIINKHTLEEATRLLAAQDWTNVTARENTDGAFSAFEGNANNKRNTALIKKNYDLKDLREKQNVEFIEQAENKSKALWKVINSERKVKNTATYINNLNANGEIHNSPENIANLFNKFFATIPERTLEQNKLSNQSPTADTTQRSPQHFPIPNLQLYRQKKK